MAYSILSGFAPSTTEPIDSRTVKANATARKSMNTYDIYEGLVVYQQDTNELYVLIDTTNYNNDLGWQLVGSNITGTLFVSGNLVVTGSITSTLGFTGSLSGTASYVTGSIFTSNNPALSASYALTASYVLGGGGGGGPESDPIFVSKSGSLATTGSNVFIGNQEITGSVHITGSFGLQANASDPSTQPSQPGLFYFTNTTFYVSLD